MANTYTTRFNMTKPEVGGDTNAWGGHLNSGLDTIDSNMVSLLLTSTQTMAGALALPSNGLNVGSGQLQVTGGNVSASGNISATGNISGVNGTFTGTFGSTGAATFGSTIAVTGAATLSSTLSVSGNVTASTAPSIGGHLTNKTYVDAQNALKLNLTGGTLTGDLTLLNGTSEMDINLGSGGGFIFGDASDIGFYNNATSAGAYMNLTSGDFIASGNVTAYSDAKLKENVETIKDALSLVKRMRGVFYDRIDTGEHGVGVIAQEMREVIPQVVRENDGTLSVAYGNLVGVLIEAVKELSAKVEALEAR